MLRFLLPALFLCFGALAQSVSISDAQALTIGKRIWINECAGTVDGLTSWNKGEDFASLGIGHFIWYPAGKRGPFEESFPPLAAWLAAGGTKLPGWMRGACPWNTRAEFMADFESARMKNLRELLAGTVALQARFCAQRLQDALPQMLKAVPKSERERVRANFQRVAAEPLGMYALIDYVNFKGEGTSPTERYKGQGWGLLQVLEEMGNGPALHAFSDAAATVLTRRVENSPKARNESKWLSGWLNRVAGYAG
ncbi:MAG: hypothetical protein ACREKL_05085 [Chthoniobacterales bacterium]